MQSQSNPGDGMSLGIKCDMCGSSAVDGLDEHGDSYCLLCLKYLKGHDEGEEMAADLMLHLAVAGAREVMGDRKVRRVFEFVMGGGEPMFRVRGVGS